MRKCTEAHLIILAFVLWPSEGIGAYTLELEASQIPRDPTKVESAAIGGMPSMHYSD